MCGICGIWHREESRRDGDATLIERMTEALEHRGPNDRGTWVGRRVALGSRRLAVIDLSRNGRQPMCNEDGSVWLVFNGEVYNFRELKERYSLVERGHRFRSRTDSEVLLHLYEEIGMDMLAELNGMFAFAIWDEKRQELHLARDRFGIKPLFYGWQAGRLLFASEIKSILRDASIPRRVNLQALHDFLTFNYVPGEQTAFDGIFEVPPAHRMTIDAQGMIQSFRYWDLPFEVDDSIDERTAVQRAQELLQLAVRRQLVADVPVGVLLSGGMDSSTLVALMHRDGIKPIHTYSVGFKEASFNELPYARIVSKSFGTIQREVIVTPQRVRDLLPVYLRYIDEPYADGSAIPTYYVCELAKDEVVVLLSGEGGDEVFGGYETYAAYRHARWFRRVPQWIRQGLLTQLVNSLPVSDKKLSLEFKMKRFLSGQDLPPAQAHLWWRMVLTEERKRQLYSADVLRQFEAKPSDRHFLEAFGRSSGKDTLNRLMHIDISVFLPDDLMIKNDRMSMAHSLEARVPMTDNELVDFMSRVPSPLKLRHFQTKYIMRQAMQDILPQAILNKKKVGLEIPYSRWLKNELHDLLLTYCEPTRLADTGLFRPEAIWSLIHEHVSGQYDHGRALWGLLNFMMWHGLYIS